MEQPIEIEWSVRIRNNVLPSGELLELLSYYVPPAHIHALYLESKDDSAVVFVSNAEYAYELLCNTIEARSKKLEILPFVSQYTISNVYPFVTNVFLFDFFSAFGTVLKVENLYVESEEIYHIMTGKRRITFLDSSKDLDLVLTKYIDYVYENITMQFATEKYCCACKDDGHSFLECVQMNNWYNFNCYFDCNCEKCHLSNDAYSVGQNIYENSKSTLPHLDSISDTFSKSFEQKFTFKSEVSENKEPQQISPKPQIKQSTFVKPCRDCIRWINTFINDNKRLTNVGHASKVVAKYRKIRKNLKSKHLKNVFYAIKRSKDEKCCSILLKKFYLKRNNVNKNVVVEEKELETSVWSDDSDSNSSLPSLSSILKVQFP